MFERSFTYIQAVCKRVDDSELVYSNLGVMSHLIKAFILKETNSRKTAVWWRQNQPG